MQRARNKKKGEDIIFARLDRFLCNTDWQMVFPSAEVVNLDFYGSYHRPISLSLTLPPILNFKRYPKRFTFEHKWLMEDDFADFVQYSW